MSHNQNRHQAEIDTSDINQSKRKAIAKLNELKSITLGELKLAWWIKIRCQILWCLI